MAFQKATTRAKNDEDRKDRIYAKFAELSEDEGPLEIPDKPRNIRASDIKSDCPRKVYYSRGKNWRARPESVNVAAVYGSTVHDMFRFEIGEDEHTFTYFFEKHLQDYGARGLYDPIIHWKAQAKPFGLSAFLKAEPKDKISALYKRYAELDLPNFQAFWRDTNFAIYRHPESGRLAKEVRLKADIEGSLISTTADVFVTDVYKGNLVAVDWKTGQPSEATQLATYAISAEQYFGWPEGSIQWGYFICTGTGECVADRGQLPKFYYPDTANSVVKIHLEEWREVVRERVQKLQWREANGIWTPKLNGLCYSACEFRKQCPMGRAVEAIRTEDAKQ